MIHGRSMLENAYIYIYIFRPINSSYNFLIMKRSRFAANVYISIHELTLTV